MKVFYNSNEINEKFEGRRLEILNRLMTGSQNLTDLFRYFRGGLKKEVLKHDLRNFQEIGLVDVIKFKGFEQVYFIKK